MARVVSGAEADPQLPPPIRDFDVDTAGKLGREIFRQDQLAWVATDVLMDKVGREKLVAEQVTAGWVVESTGPAPVVRFLRPKGDAVEAAYDITFKAGNKPALAKPEKPELTASQLVRVKAIRSSDVALRGAKRPWCGGNFNQVVVLDPEGDGWLVYFLRAKPSRDEIPVGGHFRISVSADGLTVKRVDQLFASCMTLNKQPPKEATETAALVMNHIVSAKPIETHVFLSLQDRTPFFVVTRDGKVWHVADGKISDTGESVREEDEQEPAGK